MSLSRSTVAKLRKLAKRHNRILNLGFENRKEPSDLRAFLFENSWEKGTPELATGMDITDPFKSMADGKYYSSKKKYRANLRAQGFVEVGNEKLEPKEYKPDLPKIKRQVAHSLKRIKNGERGPGGQFAHT